MSLTFSCFLSSFVAGMECTRVIRAQQLPHRTRPFIVAQTANVTSDFQAACADSGMDCFLTKPVMHDELVRALKLAYAYHHPSPPTLESP